MGSGGKTTHTTYATAPTMPEAQAMQAPTPAIPPQVDVDVWSQQQAPVDEAVDALNQLAQGVTPHALQYPSDDELGSWYQDVESAAEQGAVHLDAMAQAGMPEETVSASASALNASVAATLEALTPEQLKQLAKEQGFSHPELVGVSEGTPHPLAVWLNPMTSAETKNRIQAKAEERFAALCAGQTVAGLTYADIEPPTAQHGIWTATQQQTSELLSEVFTQVASFQAADTGEKGSHLAAAVAAENALVSAYCPEVGDESAASLKANATAAVNELVDSIPPDSQSFGPALQQLKAQGRLTDEQWAVLSMPASLRLARESTPPTEKAHLEETAESRTAQLKTLQHEYDQLSPDLTESGGTWHLKFPESLAPGADFDSVVQATAIAKKAENYFAAYADVMDWYPESPLQETDGQKPDGIGPLPHDMLQDPSQLTTNFLQWSKQKQVSKNGLKQVAVNLGVDKHLPLNAAEAKKWIVAHWDPNHDKAAIKGEFEEKKKVFEEKIGISKNEAPTTAGPDTGGSQNPAVPTHKTEAKTGFSDKNAKLLQALKQHGATWEQVPKPIDPTIVANYDFGPGESAGVLGGVHSKTVHTGPDGKKWLFKPDKATAGAKAEAEAVASKVAAAAGIPAVPVYTTKVNGQQGVVQPLVPGAKQLPAEPSSWSQSDVDALVRSHVVSWLVGDHDNNPSNVLKTTSGGLVPIDAGQSFKYYGTDTLSLNYHPNKKFGTPPPAHHQAYTAFLSGGLAQGVAIKPEAAHPVIAKLEAIPDSQWRAMLHTTAHQGAKSGDIAWVPTMRTKAAQQHGISESAVTPKQIADAFLDYACERKKTLRSAFATFFSKELKLTGDVLKYGA